ncbi:MAG: diguanylate cyclase [Spirochaetales bacterium]|uniref:Diguanylate cyclase n=1 Tax=Candidatus Thalassospirochaeta sargassi TaxID=3119039 RepID=A0AAJ1IEM9_9SPIO|nr:diguanylate cyclase [Spirochaetales bacterium]
MSTKTRFTLILESIPILVVVICLNILLRPEDPGFSEFLYTPYIIPALFSAVYHSRTAGLLIYLLSIAAVAVLHRLNSTIFPSHFQSSDGIIAAAALVLVYIFGTITRIDRIKLKNTREHLKNITKEHYRISRISAAQLEINRELEERVSGQRVTITTLYNQMHKMDSLNLQNALDCLIETVRLFTDATAVTIWKASPTSGFLDCPASLHMRGTFDSSSLLNIEDSIEGWVFRNNRLVSARMINNYENLKQMDTGRNIITMPIPLNKMVWGVLNIEEMPFVKYNLHTERLLEIIISLAEPALSRAVSHNQQIQESETDADTNLPLFSQLYNSLNRYIQSSTEDKARISLMIIEIQNFTELSKSFPASDLKKLFLKLTDEILLATAGMAEFFMYKTDKQMAVLIPGTDSDGTALLSLEILELIHSTQWLIDGSEVFLEIIIGYSSLGENASNAEGLIKHAEHLLEIQKI